MKTYFSLFDNYEKADAAVRELLAQDFAIDEINVILQETIAKNAMDVNQNQIKVKKSQELGQPATHGLDGLLGGEQAFNVPDAGHIYAAGELADLLTKTALMSASANGGLKAALIEFGLSPETAELYREGVQDGGLLVFIRVEDKKATTAREILRNHKARQIINAVR